MLSKERTSKSFGQETKDLTLNSTGRIKISILTILRQTHMTSSWKGRSSANIAYLNTKRRATFIDLLVRS